MKLIDREGVSSNPFHSFKVRLIFVVISMFHCLLRTIVLSSSSSQKNSEESQTEAGRQRHPRMRDRIEPPQEIRFLLEKIGKQKDLVSEAKSYLLFLEERLLDLSAKFGPQLVHPVTGTKTSITKEIKMKSIKEREAAVEVLEEQIQMGLSPVFLGDVSEEKLQKLELQLGALKEARSILKSGLEISRGLGDVLND
jgi:hypothetical protein